MTKKYRLSSEADGLYKEKGSKFLAYAYPIKSSGEVFGLLGQLRKDHPKSRHVCYGYSLHLDKKQWKSSDDGEPSGSAGLPILNQIRSFELNFSLVAVVRYFGGTKLGVSGLVTAYKSATIEALNQADSTEFKPEVLLEIKFNPASMHVTMNLVKAKKLDIVKTDFENLSTFSIQIRIPLDDEIAQTRSSGDSVKKFKFAVPKSKFELFAL